MSYLVEFPVERGGTVIVEMEDDQLAGIAPAAVRPGEIAVRAGESLEKAVDKLLPSVRAVGERLKTVAPDELTVALGIKVTAEAGVVVSKASGEANFTVTLTWRGAHTG
jgi:hypothetical protein